jgi:hypothetical protein
MQPSVVSHLLSEVEHNWEKSALSALMGQKDAAAALKDVQGSCQKVTKSIINGAQGEKDHVIEYMKEVCAEDSDAQEKKMCEAYAAQIESFMTYDSFHNREELDLAAFCETFYKGAVTDRASEKMKALKAVEAEELKQKEQKAKEEELKQHQAKAAASHNDVVNAEKEVGEAQTAIKSADAKLADIQKTEQEVKTIEEHAQKELQAADEHEAAAAEASAKEAADVAAAKKAKAEAARKAAEAKKEAKAAEEKIAAEKIAAEKKVEEEKKAEAKAEEAKAEEAKAEEKKAEEKKAEEKKVEKKEAEVKPVAEKTEKKQGLLAKRVQLKNKLDINQKAYIEGASVLGDGAGQGNLNVCMELADHFVKNPMAPEVKVCGTGIKMTVFLLGRCGKGSVNSANLAHTWDIGACDSGLAPSTCREYGPSKDKRMGVSQSYKITQC